ncbi:N-acetylmuramoyl-L-alanine amidase [uncultured Cohaesibacter sp.]|uniref:N-acetylmuramoyl-L-alanine amidase n=1 Tax=uncultured Cohaesibacter sp. TaxID=1002546 RepID=UPI003748413F
MSERSSRQSAFPRRPNAPPVSRFLKAPDIPSVLLELGYLSNKTDRVDLQSKQWRQKAIGSIVRSIKSFFARTAVHSSGLFITRPRLVASHLHTVLVCFALWDR